MNQSNIFQFGYIESFEPSRSNPGTNHVVTKIDGKNSCSCKGYKFHGSCYHSRGEDIKDLRKQIEFLLLMKEPITRAHFKSFESLLQWQTTKGSAKFEMFCNVALQLAMSEGTVNADTIHECLGDEICWGEKSIGTALKSLEKKGYLKYLYSFKSKRPECHGRPIGMFAITDEGRELFTKPVNGQVHQKQEVGSK